MSKPSWEKNLSDNISPIIGVFTVFMTFQNGITRLNVPGKLEFEITSFKVID